MIAEKAADMIYMNREDFLKLHTTNALKINGDNLMSYPELKMLIAGDRVVGGG